MTSAVLPSNLAQDIQMNTHCTKEAPDTLAMQIDRRALDRQVADLDTLIAIRKRLTEERQRLGLSVFQLAVIGGIEEETQSYIENGLGEPPDALYLARCHQLAKLDVLFVLTGIRAS